MGDDCVIANFTATIVPLAGAFGNTSLIDSFSTECPPGMPLLQWYGMTLTAKQAAERGVAPFPHMLRWMR